MKAKDLADLLLQNPDMDLAIDMPVVTDHWDGTELETLIRGKVWAVDFEINESGKTLVIQSGA